MTTSSLYQQMGGCPTGKVPYAWNAGYGTSQSTDAKSLINTSTNGNWYVMRNLTIMQNPAQCPYINDSACNWSTSTSGQYWEITWDSSYGFGLGLRHFQKANSVFFDGHADSLSRWDYRSKGITNTGYIVENNKCYRIITF